MLFLFLSLNVLLLYGSPKRIVLMTCLCSISRHSYLSEILYHLINFTKELWVQKIRIKYLYGFYIRKKRKRKKRRRELWANRIACSQSLVSWFFLGNPKDDVVGACPNGIGYLFCLNSLRKIIALHCHLCCRTRT